MRPLYSGLFALTLLVSATACYDANPTDQQPPPPVDPDGGPRPVGVYRIGVTGIGTDMMSSSVVPVDPETGASLTLANAGSGIVFESMGGTSLTDGPRGQNGHRYISFQFRVRNGTGVPLQNLTILMVSRSNTIAGTPISSLRKFDNTNADPAIAPLVVPTGAVTLGSDLITMHAPYPDVLQVFTEAEIAAITPPAGVTNIFPVGYVVRHRDSTHTRRLAVPTDPNQFDGVLTLSFRFPLQASPATDPFSMFFEILAITDTETRMTESMEEAQDTAAVRRLRDRASLLGATTVTVLNGSTAMDPAVVDYPGQRQICSPRTAGTAASPVNTIVSQAAYSGMMLLAPGESLNPCAAYFRSGTTGRPATNVPFTLTAHALDRYGNLRTAVADTIRLERTGAPATIGSPTALVSGSAPQLITYTDYGLSQVRVVGRRMRGDRQVLVAGVTRTWTAGAGTTNWNAATNWSPAAVPMSLDSVFIPVAAPMDPALISNVQVQGVTVEDVAIIALGAFDLTAGGSVTTGLTGGITNTTGRLFLSGTAQGVGGVVPTTTITGTYSLTANITARAPLRVDAGRLTVSALRAQASSQ
jgi:hypothetical protein